MRPLVKDEGRVRIQRLELLLHNFNDVLVGLVTSEPGCCSHPLMTILIHVVLAAGITKHGAGLVFLVNLPQGCDYGGKTFIFCIVKVNNKLRNAGVGQNMRCLTLAVDELERSLVFDDRVISEVAGHRTAGHQCRHGGRNHRLRSLRLDGGCGFIYHHQGTTRLVENNLECRVHYNLQLHVENFERVHRL